MSKLAKDAKLNIEGTFPVKKRSPLKTIALAFIVLLLICLAVAYAWLDSLNVKLHKNSQSIAKAKKALSSKPTNLNQPINILLIGSDRRFNKHDTGRSDTLMVIHIDYRRKKVYLISIPRDTRVRIPGLGFDKINAAYAYGGPQLSIRAVQNYTDLKIHHYIEVDFNGFKKLVDTLGGIDVEVKKTINNRSRKYRMYIPKGKVHMDGELALNYVRYRHGDSDFQRAERQQNFLKALSANALKWSAFWRLPTLINIFADNTETDMSIRELSDLASFLKTVRSNNNLETVTLAGRTGMLNGVSYVFPDYQANQVILEAVKQGKSIEEVTAKSGSSSNVSLTNQNIKVTVLNGTTTNGLATKVARQLGADGFRIASIATADQSDYQRTQVLAKPGKQEVALKVKKAFFPKAKVGLSYQEFQADVIVILGKDYLDWKTDY
jgi:LCP family protein required for cell wall assembly